VKEHAPSSEQRIYLGPDDGSVSLFICVYAPIDEIGIATAYESRADG
jgi:hypothetical protein